VPTHAPHVALRYLNDAAMASMFQIPADMMPLPVEINQLDNQALVRYYEREWKKWE
jgi:spermidine synthase